MCCYISIRGNNSTRKTSKMNVFLDYLSHIGYKREILKNEIIFTKGDDKWIYIGQFNNNSYLGLDRVGIEGYSKQEDRLKLFQSYIKRFNPNWIITEGYFNNRGSEEYDHPDKFKAHGIELVKFYYHLFEDLETNLEEQKQRAKQTTHRCCTIDDFYVFNRRYNMLREKYHNGKDYFVTKVDPFCDNDYYVKEFFNINYTPKEKVNTIDF